MFTKGNKIIGFGDHNKNIIKEIIDVRKTGYSWKYEDLDRVFMSENSNDPLFEHCWELKC